MQQFNEVFSSFFNGAAGRTVSACAALVLVMAVSGWFFKKNKSTKMLTYMAVCLSLSVIISLFTVFKMPQGGSVKICSMLFISFIGYFFGPAAGIIGGVTYGFIDIAMGPYIVHPVQLFLDYPLAYAALGLSGFFVNKKLGLHTGFIAGALLRGVVHTISGVIFFAKYAGEQNVWIYSSTYNFSFILPEIAITCAIISVPVVFKAIERIKATAVR